MDMLTMNVNKFKAIQRTVNTVLLPIGMVEAHGPHCALGTDVLIPREFVKRLEEEAGDKILMAPEIAYGHSWGLAPFAGTIDISPEIFSNYVYEICKRFLENGFEYIILFNGHGGNIASLELVAEKIADLGGRVLTISWFADYREQIKEITTEPGHAGEDETSLILAIDQNLAYTENVGSHQIPISKKYKFKEGGKVLYPEGFSGNAGAASLEKGEKLFKLMTELVVKDIELLWDFDLKKGGRSKHVTMDN